MKNREIISDIRNSLRSATNDEWLPGKFIYSKLVGVTGLFLKREGDDKRLHKYTELFTSIECLRMKEEPLINCCHLTIPDCNLVMKSVEKIPTAYSTRYGYLLNLTSLDYDRDYIPTTAQQYKYIKSREFPDKSKRYFWNHNGHIIIPNSQVHAVTLTGMFVNKAEALKLNGCDDPGCVRFMDQEFIAPAHLIQDIKNAVVAELSNTYKRFSTDELTNNNSQEKTNPQSI